MTAGDITVTAICKTSAEMVTALSGAAVVADKIVAVPEPNSMGVRFAIIKAA